MIRALLPLLCLSVAACGKSDESKTPPPAPLPSPTAPAPRTPVMQITPAPGATPAWLKPRPAQDADLRAPHADLLTDPVVERRAAR
ncbi:hypothetical protein [uncultured Sphingomonas sp.]|uniref:hypothetical protein n=1 Tax=uncultured Sphingomonas sp. TaxID=158754 RepID=UPI0030F4F1D5